MPRLYMQSPAVCQAVHYIYYEMYVRRIRGQTLCTSYTQGWPSNYDVISLPTVLLHKERLLIALVNPIMLHKNVMRVFPLFRSFVGVNLAFALILLSTTLSTGHFVSSPLRPADIFLEIDQKSFFTCGTYRAHILAI